MSLSVRDQEMTAEKLDEFSRAWLRGDVRALADYLTEDVAYTPTDGRTVRGRDEVVRRFAEILGEDADCEVTFEPSVVSGSQGLCRWHLKGEVDAALVELGGIDVYEFEGSLIRSKDVYRKSGALS